MTTSARAEEEAASWIARREAGPIDAREQQAFAAWQESDPRNRAALEDLDAIWADLGVVAQEAGERRGALRVPANDRAGAGWRRMASIAAIIVVGFVGVVAYQMERAPSYSTHVGEYRAFALTDGSRITLNTDTELKVAFSDQQRTINLERGEAMFDVAHDTARPFIVSSRYGSVRAVGTRFVVRIEPDHSLRVLVTQGRVIVARTGPRPDPAKAVAVSAGHEVDTTPLAMTPLTVDRDGMMKATAWQSGEIYFNGEPLGRAVAEMQRYSTRKIVIDPAVSRYRVGGSFSTSDLRAFLDVLQAAFPVAVTEQGGEIRIGPGRRSL